MRVAVLMSTYNGERYIEEQINSILSQKGDFELDLWVRDDGSIDKTIEILKQYSDKNLLNWYSGDNVGPAGSFINLLFNHRDYDYYSFADQDDVWMDDKIKIAIERLKEISGPAVYFSNAELVDSKLNSLGRNVYMTSPKLDFYTLCCAGGILGCTMVMNSELVKMIVQHRKPLDMVMHDFYVSQFCSAIKGEFVYDNKPHMKYRQHERNVVGVSTGNYINKLRVRWEEVTHKGKRSISEQATEISDILNGELSTEYVNWLNRLSVYKQSILNRIRLAISRKTRYMNLNSSIKNRLSIILGNR